jgi:hypothetical protein
MSVTTKPLLVYYYFTSNTNAHMNLKQKYHRNNAIAHTNNQPSSNGSGSKFSFHDPNPIQVTNTKLTDEQISQ